MTDRPHLWVRGEQRPSEERVGITPGGVRTLLGKGFRVTVEQSAHRVIPEADYSEAGAEVAPFASWPDAPADAIIFGLKELPDDGSPLHHRHIMFGHAFKGQPDGADLLDRFRAGGGALYDLEYLIGEDGRRVAAFGYWAGYVGAAVSLIAYAAQEQGTICPPVSAWPNASAMQGDVRTALVDLRPDALVIGALGRVGTGTGDLCRAMGLDVTGWDMAETSSGGPFPEILEHRLFFNCILAGPQTPVFVPASAVTADRRLRVIGDIACDPRSSYSPIKVYGSETTWQEPATRVHDAPPLDVMAIDNLPSLLPRESSEDFAAQLLPHLESLDRIEDGVWGRAHATFRDHVT